MTRAVLRVDDVDGFLSRAREAAQRADRGQALDQRVTLSFEDSQRMFTVLSAARRRLMVEVMRGSCSIADLSRRLHRQRASVTKDVRLLELSGLVVSRRELNPGHRVHKVVRAVAPTIDIVARFGRSV
jgi:predicted transcriptional regulator